MTTEGKDKREKKIMCKIHPMQRTKAKKPHRFQVTIDAYDYCVSSSLLKLFAKVYMFDYVSCRLTPWAHPELRVGVEVDVSSNVRLAGDKVGHGLVLGLGEGTRSVVGVGAGVV